jgi:hypothetical protein
MTMQFILMARRAIEAPILGYFVSPQPLPLASKSSSSRGDKCFTSDPRSEARSILQMSSVVAVLDLVLQLLLSSLLL